ncbi:MAG: diguanylate cyclase [Oceanospirillaceae bacterium]|nr:diguanylate cyclase [Oceanospirillaceae bacterium]
MVGRWDGEEFIIVLAELNLALLEKTLTQLNHRVENMSFGIERHITISIGFAR